MEENRNLRVLCLDAGGIRGVIQIEMLRKLQQRIRWYAANDDAKIRDYFDIIGGTCTGGILALCLAKGIELDAAREMYNDMSELFASGNPPYSSESLEKILENTFNDDKLSSIGDRPRVVVPCVSEVFQEPKLVLVTNYEQDKHDPLIRKVAQATYANPGFFKAVDVWSDLETPKLGKLVSGYLAYNPTLDVLTKIREREGKHSMKNGILVSLGTGIFPQYHRTAIDVEFRENILGYGKELFTAFLDRKSELSEARAYREAAMARSGHLTKRACAWCRMIGATYERLEPHLGSFIDLDCSDQYRMELMTAETRKYVHEIYTKDRIDEIAKLLVHGKKNS